MTSPFFSIIIPTYNRAAMIADTIQSALQQSFSDFEIIVIDDGSNDDTQFIIKEKYNSNHKVKYFYQQNSERGAARNLGIKKSQGRYLVFFDSDDFMHNNHLIALKKAIDKFPDANFLATKYDFSKNGKKFSSGISHISEGWYDVNLFLKGNLLACNYCIKKENPDLHLFAEDREYAVMEDWMFLIQNLVNDKIYIIDQITITMNDHEDRSMKNNNSQIISRRLLATDWLKKNVALSIQQVKILDGYSYYFCSIHSYVDGRRKQAMDFLKQFTQKSGFTASAFILLIKIIIGYRLIQKIRS